MAVREILRMGDPRLLQSSNEVHLAAISQLTDLIEDMWETMQAANGIGISAPQIGVLLRVVLFGTESTPRYPDAPPIPPTLLINPHIEVLSEERENGWEGCLSVPGMRGLVSRNTHIRYSGLDADGRPFSREADGFHARVVQHECDHLDGVLYPLRIEDLRNFGFEEELAVVSPVADE